jgi:hypothetical protein
LFGSVLVIGFGPSPKMKAVAVDPFCICL